MAYEETDNLELLKERQAEALQAAKDFRKEIRKEMKALQRTYEEAAEGTDADEITAAREAFFQKKAIVDYLLDLIEQ